MPKGDGQAGNGSQGEVRPALPSSQESSFNYRGLDSGLAKAAPSADGLSQKTYRSYRRRLQLYAKQCLRRGKDTAVEGSFLVISLLKDNAWEATEQLDLDEIERSADPFKPVMELLDKLYQYEDVVEIPSRCEEFFQEFGRQKNEEMQSFLIRHQTMMKKMKEIQIAIPPLLAGWHLLTRAGVPRWTHVQVKSMCGGELDYDKVATSLLRMFGGDHKPNPKDLARGSKDDAFYEEEEDEEFWLEDEWHDDWQEAFYEEGYEDEEEDEIPEEVEAAADQMDEAYVSYVESRRRMRELALSRGFYPVMAIGPEFDRRSSPKGGKGRGKSKGSKAKGKGKGSSKGATRRSTWNSRPMSGLRRPGGGSSGGGTSSTMILTWAMVLSILTVLFPGRRRPSAA